MLTGFQFANYRAFRRGQIHIKPLTIIVGANSVGKTALLQIPLLLKQSAIQGESKFRGALRVHGRDVSFGQPRQLFHNLSTTNDLEFEFNFRSKKLLSEIANDLVDEFMSTINGYCEYALLTASQVKTKAATKLDPNVSKQISSHKDNIEKYIQNERKSQSNKGVSRITNLLDIVDSIVYLIKTFSGADVDVSVKELLSNDLKISLSHRYILSRRVFRVPITSISEADLRRIIFYCAALRQLKSEQFSIKFSLGLTKSGEHLDHDGSLFVKSIAARNAGNTIFGLNLSETTVTSVYSEIIDIQVDHRHSDLNKSINFGGSIFNILESNWGSRVISGSAAIINNVIGSCIKELQQNVSGNSIEHIGPLRAHPKRFYFLDQNYSVQSGESVVEKLREDKELLDKVNFWLKKFRVTINVTQLVEIISRLSVRSENFSFDLDITDVGFGISQFLPILVEGLLAPPQRMLIVEQPEIHLHPKMQAELADFFIDIANITKNSGDGDANSSYRALLIETHSEYLLNRIRRRIAEGTVSHADVAIYFVEPSDAGEATTVRGISIPVDGNFEWPKDFYEVELQDALAFLAKAGQGTKK